MQQTLPPLKSYDHFGNTFSDYPLETGPYQQQHYPQDRSIDQYQLQPQPHTTQPLPSPSESIDSVNGQQPYPTTPMSIQYLQLPIPPMNPPNYYQSGGHRPDARQDMNQTRQPIHQSPHMQSGNGNGHGNGQLPNQRYVPPPHHGYSSDGSPVGYGYNATQQPGYSHYQQSPYSPYQSLAAPPPPVHQIPGPPGPSGFMVSPPQKDMAVSASAQSQSRKIAPKRRMTSPKKKNSPTDTMSLGGGREKWKWDVPDEIYARMNSEEKKQVRNRCGARAFRAKRKAEDASRAASTEHLKQQVMILHHQLNAARARLGEPPVELPSLVPPEGFEASSDCLGLGLDFQGGESEDGSMEFS